MYWLSVSSLLRRSPVGEKSAAIFVGGDDGVAVRVGGQRVSVIQLNDLTGRHCRHHPVVGKAIDRLLKITGCRAGAGHINDLAVYHVLAHVGSFLGSGKQQATTTLVIAAT